MSAAQGQGTTLLAELTSQLQVIGTSTPDGTEPPAAILWTDPKEHWRSLAPALLESIPELLIYGEYKPETKIRDGCPRVSCFPMFPVQKYEKM